VEAAAVGLQATHQGINHRSTTANGVVEMGLRFKPLAKQRGHGRRVGVSHRHAANQEGEQIHPMAQKGIAEVTIHQRPKGTGEVTHRREMRQQAPAALQQLRHAIHPRPQGQQGQSIGSGGNRLKRLHKTPPFGGHLRAAQAAHHSLKIVVANGDAQIPFRQQHIPGAIGNHFDGLPQRAQHLGQGIAAGPTSQTTPEGWTGFKVIALALKAMGGSTGLVVGFQHQHLTAGAGTQTSGTQPTDAAADHQNVDVASDHPLSIRVIIVVIGARRCALDCCFPC